MCLCKQGVVFTVKAATCETCASKRNYCNLCQSVFRLERVIDQSIMSQAKPCYNNPECDAPSPILDCCNFTPFLQIQRSTKTNLFQKPLSQIP